MKKTIGASAFLAMAMTTTVNAAPAAHKDGAKENRMPASLPAEVVAVGCKMADLDCLVAARTFTEDGPDYTSVSYSYCPQGSKVVSGKNLNFCASPKPMML